MAITLNGTTGITTPDLTSTDDITANSSAVLTAASSLASANLTGALPAIDGAALTGLSAGGTELLSTATMTGSAVDITLPTSGYSKLTLMYKSAGITLNTNQWMRLRCSTNGGTTFDATNGNYWWVATGFYAAVYNNYSDTDTSGKMHAVYNVAAASLALDINNNATTAGSTTFNGHSIYVNDSNTPQHNLHGFKYVPTTVVNAIRLFPDSGTFNSGTVYLYGWKV